MVTKVGHLAAMDFSHMFGLAVQLEQSKCGQDSVATFVL
jgi:hypothetical protein